MLLYYPTDSPPLLVGAIMPKIKPLTDVQEVGKKKGLTLEQFSNRVLIEEGLPENLVEYLKVHHTIEFETDKNGEWRGHTKAGARESIKDFIEGEGIQFFTPSWLIDTFPELKASIVEQLADTEALTSYVFSVVNIESFLDAYIASDGYLHLSSYDGEWYEAHIDGLDIVVYRID